MKVDEKKLSQIAAIFFVKKDLSNTEQKELIISTGLHIPHD